MPPKLRPIAGLFVLLLCLFQPAGAYRLTEITDQAKEILIRQKQRAEVLNEMKIAGIIGENSTGYLQVMNHPEAAGHMVEQENEDRRKLYALIAKQNRLGSGGVGAVENDAAAEAREKAPKGTYVQLPTGRWTQKT